MSEEVGACDGREEGRQVNFVPLQPWAARTNNPLVQTGPAAHPQLDRRQRIWQGMPLTTLGRPSKECANLGGAVALLAKQEVASCSSLYSFNYWLTANHARGP